MDIKIKHYKQEGEKEPAQPQSSKNITDPNQQSGFRRFFAKPIPKKVWITILVIIGVAALALVIWMLLMRFENKEVKISQKTSSKVPSPLNGVMVEEEVAGRRPFAVMIENSPEARPQTGLDQAGLVYETVAEGGIIRFMALYVENAPEDIGPVRSSRNYYVDWAAAFEAFYAHCGGSADSLAQIRTEHLVKDLDQFQYAQSYWRVSDRYAPHNLYTSIPRLKDAAAGAKYDLNKKYESLKFKKDAPAIERPPTAEVTIGWPGSFEVRWVYDQKTNSYSRFMAGLPHKDAVSGVQITAKTIIVEETNQFLVGNNPTTMETIGEGKVQIFRDGQRFEGHWKKASKTDRTKYYDVAGKPIELTAGVIWIEVVSPNIVIG